MRAKRLAVVMADASLLNAKKCAIAMACRRIKPNRRHPYPLGGFGWEPRGAVNRVGLHGEIFFRALIFRAAPTAPRKNNQGTTLPYGMAEFRRFLPRELFFQWISFRKINQGREEKKIGLAARLVRACVVGI